MDVSIERLRDGAGGTGAEDLERLADGVTVPPRERTAAIRACAAGETTLGQSVIRRLVNTDVQQSGTVPIHAALATPTSREVDVLRVMAEGRSNAGIGARLFLAETTVKTHVARILAELGVRNRVQARRGRP